ncbi:response regulator [Streptomyces kunmingensis]|uniref:Response regulator n=1 Tax=Streptomyces kunmingensis TaxID=68225 RepID=A0ABU6C9U2_9ACTN|nr:response regulator [Streptomyces kunmingensis]MEB3961393.1 response regulator [Streptomyces kunmingensis]
MPTELTVLLVDNHEESLFALEGALAPLGCPTERAQSGEEALKAVLRGGIDLIILDVVMPGITGLEVARHLHRLDQTADIPVILLTGLFRHAQLAEEAYELQVTDILTKPLDPWMLRVKVASHLRYLRRIRSLEAQVAAATPAEDAARRPRRPSPSTRRG